MVLKHKIQASFGMQISLLFSYWMRIKSLFSPDPAQRILFAGGQKVRGADTVVEREAVDQESVFMYSF